MAIVMAYCDMYCAKIDNGINIIDKQSAKVAIVIIMYRQRFDITNYLQNTDDYYSSTDEQHAADSVIAAVITSGYESDDDEPPSGDAASRCQQEQLAGRSNPVTTTLDIDYITDFSSNLAISDVVMPCSPIRGTSILALTELQIILHKALNKLYMPVKHETLNYGGIQLTSEQLQYCTLTLCHLNVIKHKYSGYEEFKIESACSVLNELVKYSRIEDKDTLLCSLTY
jgi:hypothetical protein